MGFEIGMLFCPHTVQTTAKGDERCTGKRTDSGGMPPVKPVAIVEDIGDLQAKKTPEGRPQPIDVLQWHPLGHRTPRTRQKELKSNDKQFKGLTCEMHEKNGRYTYTYGSATTMDEAKKIRQSILDKFPQAFIVTFEE